jgi:p-hydroxybenzoate 3-monooxygenase
MVERTQVGIVAAGPAGMMLAHLLRREGVDSIVVEARSREYVQERVRAGVLEQGTCDLLAATGVGGRLRREGLIHHGIELRYGGPRHRIDLSGVTGGGTITIYPQREVVKDLTDAHLSAGGEIFFEAADVSVHDFHSSAR